MRKIKRYKNQRRVIILRGLKYLLIITLLLIALAFILTNVLFRNDGNEEEEETSAEVTETTAAVTEYDPWEDENIDNAWAMFLVNNDNPLPSNYDDIIETATILDGQREIDVRALDHIERMIADAKEDGIDLLVVSAYRTMSYQQQNFDNSVKDRMDNRGMTYDEAYEDTLKEVALPGASEHNAGLALDIMCEEYQSMDDDGFENTDAFKWLNEHAHEYGFILRYPKDKFAYTNIIYEPWHYRFVGVYFANEIKQSGLCLEEYYSSMGWLDENGKAVKMRGPYDEIEREAKKRAETAVTEETEPKETMPSIPYSEQKVTIVV